MKAVQSTVDPFQRKPKRCHLFKVFQQEPKTSLLELLCPWQKPQRRKDGKLRGERPHGGTSLRHFPFLLYFQPPVLAMCDEILQTEQCCRSNPQVWKFSSWNETHEILRKDCSLNLITSCKSQKEKTKIVFFYFVCFSPQGLLQPQ